jgi:hypothetical protein
MRRLLNLLAVVLVFSSFLAAASETRQIRLRNETITTPPRTNAAAKASAWALEKPSTGLFLVQFEGAVEPGWKAELRSIGVELLKYVPDDAFIARLENVPPARIQALAYVRWVGLYLPDHKIHPRLAAAAHAAPQTNQVLAVTVLISPQATAAELAAVRSFFPSISHESHLRQRTFLRGHLPPANLDALAQSSAVLWIERAPRHKLVDEAASELVGGDDGAVGTPTLSQQLGFSGAGVTVSVADTGLDSRNTNSMHPDLSGRVTGFKKAPKQGRERVVPAFSCFARSVRDEPSPSPILNQPLPRRRCASERTVDIRKAMA